MLISISFISFLGLTISKLVFKASFFLASTMHTPKLIRGFWLSKVVLCLYPSHLLHFFFAFAAKNTLPYLGNNPDYPGVFSSVGS